MGTTVSGYTKNTDSTRMDGATPLRTRPVIEEIIRVPMGFAQRKPTFPLSSGSSSEVIPMPWPVSALRTVSQVPLGERYKISLPGWLLSSEGAQVGGITRRVS